MKGFIKKKKKMSRQHWLPWKATHRNSRVGERIRGGRIKECVRRGNEGEK